MTVSYTGLLAEGAAASFYHLRMADVFLMPL